MQRLAFSCLVVCNMYVFNRVWGSSCCHFVDVEFFLANSFGRCADIVTYMLNIFFVLGNDVQNAPFFVGKLGIKTLPCVILFRLDEFLYLYK